VGTGLTFRRVLAQNPDGFNAGVDLTPAMLHRAEQRAQKYPDVHAELQIGDAYKLPYPDARFDLLINQYMFDLLPEDDMVQVLQEYHRVLRPGGRLLMTTLALPRRFSQQLWDTLYRIYPPLLGGCRGVTVLPFLDEAGFLREQHAFMTQWTYPSEVVLAIKKGLS